MDYKIEKMALGIDDKVDYYYKSDDLQKMIIDKDTAMALQWQLMKEKFEKAVEGMIPIPPREWTYTDILEKMVAEGAYDGRGYSRRV